MACLTRAERQAQARERLAQLNSSSLAPVAVVTPPDTAEPNQVDPATPVSVYTAYANKSGIPLTDETAGLFLAETRLEMGRDAVSWLEQTFEHIKVKMVVQPTGSDDGILNRFTGYEHGDTPVVFIVGERRNANGEIYEQNIGVLPAGREGYEKSNHLMRVLTEQFGLQPGGEVALDKNSFINMVGSRYGQADTRFQKPSILKKKGARHTLADLRKFYGRYYPNLFSKVYAITDTNQARFSYNSRGEHIGDKLVGKSVIFYSKFPSSSITVDQLLEQGGSGNHELGYIVLDEKAAYSNTEELLQALDKINTSNTKEQRMVMSPRILEGIFKAMYYDNEFTDDQYNRVVSEFLNDYGDNAGYDANDSKKLRAIHINAERFIGRLRELIVNDDMFARELNKILGDKELFPYGVYISPTIVTRKALRDAGIAAVDETNRDFLYEHLDMEGLALPAVSLPTFQMDFDNNEAAREAEIRQLLSFNPNQRSQAPHNATRQQATIQMGSGRLDITPRQPQAPRDIDGSEKVKPVIGDIMAAFDGLGISTNDIHQVVSNEFASIFMNNPSAGYAAAVDQYFTSLCR